MSKLVECVPNFSEGNNKEVIDAIGEAVSQTPGCILLDVDAGPSTNRTVYTFVGSPDAVVEGALRAARVAFQLIDMGKHRGEHPRMGALDVCPFIPVRNVTMEECIRCANLFGQQLSVELGVPVYLYGEAARKESRKSLPAIRAGEYEALPEKVVSRLGLDSLSPFNPQERIIEYLVQSGQADGGLVSKSLHTFVRAVGARSAAPGGGSVSAAMSALGAALGCMVGLMSYGKRQFEALELVMRKLIPPFHQAMNELIVMVDTDSLAFSSYMVAAKALEAGVFGAYFNVVTNLKDVTDEAFRKEMHGRISSFLAEAQQSAALVLELLESRGQ
ncbi:3-hydroxy-2-methylbutyryl-CoA dehydrogenase [Platysternon megacephalum]|uniref:Formimidoyltransferase-cyclodeaminase n=1 Tax=Platysternon megacephalum TaxID=55544 RepID=A0A4D9DIS8_9SAUR|nr:3-hydroxy-2-methylbutyryl-CoA dehydrogenase [Platysternon megacephalum]